MIRRELARCLIAICASSALTSAWAQSTVRVSVGPTGIQTHLGAFDPALSEDGRWVTFCGQDGLVPGDLNGYEDVLLHDRLSGNTTVASMGIGGSPANGGSCFQTLSADARYLAFLSDADNLVVGDTNNENDVFVLDRQTGSTVRVSVNSSGAQASGGYDDSPALSADGRVAAFLSTKVNLVPGDTNQLIDVFVRDLNAGTTTRVSVSTAGAQSFSYADSPALSGNGRFVTFTTDADDLAPGDTNGTGDIYLHDRTNGTTVRASLGNGGAEGDGPAIYSDLSDDGRYLAFDSYATNLIAGDSNGTDDIFVRDLQTGIVTRVNVNTAGAQADASSILPKFSSDGRWVSFYSDATNLVPGDTNGLMDYFLRDRQFGSTVCVSTRTGGIVAGVGYPGSAGDRRCISADGRFVAFGSPVSDLVAGDSNNVDDAFVYDRLSVSAPVWSYCTAKLNSAGCTPVIGSAGEPSLGGNDNFFLVAQGELIDKPGLFLWSTGPAASPFGGGTLCIAAPVHRTPGQNSGASIGPWPCAGTYSFHFSQAYMSANGIGAGQGLYGQYWSRDQGFAAPNNIAPTDAMQFTTFP